MSLTVWIHVATFIFTYVDKGMGEHVRGKQKIAAAAVPVIASRGKQRLVATGTGVGCRFRVKNN